MATYFGSRPAESDWTANGSAESGHDFLNQINEQKGKIAGQEGQIATQRGIVDQAREAYSQAYQNQRGYGDLYAEAKGSEGVDDARAQYQHSLDAVNATARAMNRLPSSINANSNVVLNSNQRNAALGNQMAKYQGVLDDWTRQNQGDLSQYQTALGAAQNLAGQNMAQDQARVAQALADKQTEMDNVNKMYDQLLQERAIMRQIYGDMYEDEYKHMQRELEIWADNLQAETARYGEEQANYRARLQLEAQNKAADINKYLGSGYVWNGSTWVKPTNNSASVSPYISTDGTAYTPQTGSVSVNPMGIEGNPNAEAYVADPNMMARLAYRQPQEKISYSQVLGTPLYRGSNGNMYVKQGDQYVPYSG